MDAPNQLQIEQDQETDVASFNRKQLIIESRGKNVAIDLLFYSCLEYERLLNAKGDTNTHIIRWPLLKSDNDSEFISSELATDELHNHVTRLITWYRDNFPALSVRGVIDREILNEVVEPLVSMNLDLAKLYRAKTNDKIPIFDALDTNNQFWHHVETSLQATFPQHASMYIRYMLWSYAAEPVPEFEVGDVPPVGRNAPRITRRERDERGGRGAGPRGVEKRGIRPRDRDGQRSGGIDRSNASNKRDRHPTDEKFRKHDKDRERGPRNSRKNTGEVDPTIEAAALADVTQAIQQLSTDASLIEVVLKPTNSFYRRIQHQKVVDAGYSSFSVGEGAQRAVKVSRNP